MNCTSCLLPTLSVSQSSCNAYGTAGAIIAANADMNGLTGIMACWVGLFAPGILLIYGLLPWWARFRQLDIYRRYVACF